MGMLLHRQGEARGNSGYTKPSREVESGVQENTKTSGSRLQENTGRSGGRKPPSKPKKP